MIPFLVPFECIGEFKFENLITGYSEKHSFEYLKDTDDIDLDSYIINEAGISLYVNSKSQIIESISCKQECLYKGRNLIGMHIDEFVSHTGEKYYGEIDEVDFEEDNIPQYVYEFDDIGLQVWTKNDIVVTVIASSACEDD